MKMLEEYYKPKKNPSENPTILPSYDMGGSLQPLLSPFNFSYTCIMTIYLSMMKGEMH